MRLSHLHLPKPIPYSRSLQLQEALLEKHFAYNTAIRHGQVNHHSGRRDHPQGPSPTLLTFQTLPTYTVGRRHLKTNPLSSSQISFLTGVPEEPESPQHSANPLATFYPSPRGGLLTYHAPGQLTAYLILNLRTHKLTPRCYIRMLEETVMRTCARHGVPNTTTTEDPGVWIADNSVSNRLQSSKGDRSDTLSQTKQQKPTDRKICAIGVHVTRGITSHGIGFNIFDSPIETDLSLRRRYTLPQVSIYDQSITKTEAASSRRPADSTISAPGFLSWGFSRIVACGLEGKSVTWLKQEQEQNAYTTRPDDGEALLRSVGESLAQEVAASLNIDNENIESIRETELINH